MNGSSKRWLRLGACLLLCLCTWSAWAQGKLAVWGTVTDSLGEALIAAQVVLYHTDDPGRMLGFASTNSEGQYRIECDHQEHLRLQVTALGYETLTIERETNQRSQLEINLSLRSRFYELAEVEVVVERTTQAVQPSDTLGFAAADFRDGSERNVEQLIRHIPGMQVDQMGRISFQGKQVAKILIEGEDMVGSQYQMASRSISAEVIDSLEVIDHYVESSLLSGVLRSDQMVLNLKLDERVKQGLKGQAEIAGGFPSRFDGRLNGFALQSQRKLLLLGRATSTGESLHSWDDTWGTLEEDLIPLTPRRWRNEPIMSAGNPAQQVDNPQWANFNRAAQLTGTYHWRPNDHWKTKVRLFGSYNQEEAWQSVERSFLTNDQPLDIRESYDFADRALTYGGELESEYVWGKRSATQLRLQGNALPQWLRGDYLTKTNTLIDSLPWQLDRHTQSWEGRLRWLVRLNPYQALIVQVSHREEELDSDFQALSPRYAELDSPNWITGGRLQQIVTSAQQRQEGQVNWLYNRKSWAVEQAAGYYRENGALDHPWSAAGPLNWQEVFWRQQVAKRFGRLLIDGELTLRRYRFTEAGRLGETNAAWKNSGNTRLAVHYEFSRSSRLRLSYRYQPLAVATADLLGGQLLRSFRSWQVRSTVFRPLQTQRLQLSYRQRNEAKGRSMNASIYWMKPDGQYRPAYEYGSTLEQLSWQWSPAYGQGGLNGAVQQYLFTWQTALHAEWQTNWSVVPLAVGNQEQVFISRHQRWRVASVSTIKENWRLKLGLAHSTNHLKHQDDRQRLGQNQQWETQLTLLYHAPSTPWRGEFGLERWQWQAADSRTRPLHFAQLRLSYEAPERNCSWELEAANLLNERALVQEELTVNYTGRSSIRLVPRSVLLRCRFRF